MTDILFNSLVEKPRDNRVAVIGIARKNADAPGSHDARFLSDLTGIACRRRRTGLANIRAFYAPIRGRRND